MIEHDGIYLVPFTQETVALLVAWHNTDPWFDDVMSDVPGPKSALEIQSIYNAFLPPKGRLFVGGIKKDDKSGVVPIGVVALANIDHKNRTAEIYGGIGFEAERAKGYGNKAIAAIIKWGREELGLHRIEAWVKSKNKFAVSTLQSCGFVIECEMKDKIFQNGKFQNMTLLANTGRGEIDVDDFVKYYKEVEDKTVPVHAIGLLKQFIRWKYNLPSKE